MMGVRNRGLGHDQLYSGGVVGVMSRVIALKSLNLNTAFFFSIFCSLLSILGFIWVRLGF